MTSSSSTYNSQDLLVLPRSDLIRRGNVTGSSGTKATTNNSNNGVVVNTTSSQSKSKSSLVLMKLPSSSKNDNSSSADASAEDNRPDHILADSKRATLMTKNGKSYSLVKVGTSNTLVLWNPTATADTNDNDNNNNNNNNNTNSDNNDEPKSKRLKMSSSSSSSNDDDKNTNHSNIQLCHLLVPGGSGSSFMICQPNKQQTLESLIVEAAAATNGEAKKEKKVFFPKSTSVLVKLWHFSNQEIYDMMRKQSNIIGLPVENDDEKDDTTNNMMWYTLSEEEIWQGRMAIIETICEEYDHDNDHDGDCDGDGGIISVVFDEMKNHVYDRLKPFFKNKRRLMAIADQYCHLATTSKEQQRHIIIQSNIIHQWILQDLLLRGTIPSLESIDDHDKAADNDQSGDDGGKKKSTTKTNQTSQNNSNTATGSSSSSWYWSKIADAWKSRLPLCWEKYVSVETLKDVMSSSSSSSSNIQVVGVQQQQKGGGGEKKKEKLIIIDPSQK